MVNPKELWQARRAAIDAQISRIIHKIPERAAAMDPWDIQLLAVRMADGPAQFAEVDGRIEHVV